ncbi:MAG TPA: glucan biosynthesis protein, partial [Longimicrobiales bacterium]|nr:glucan biosynthesis protein [Longimicrobiales bacterium]
MSGLEPRLRVAPLALLLLPLWGCGAEPEQASTLPRGGRPAKPASTVSALVEPVSAAGLRAHVEAKARALAGLDYSPPRATLPEALRDLDYEQYRAIRFRPEAALWKGATPFEVQLMHPGFLFEEPVRIHLVEDGEVRSLPFDPGLFEYDQPAADLRGGEATDFGYSGFRLHYPLNDPAVHDEVVVFQGASYFRIVGPGHVYGLSSRGLAI